MNTDKSRLQEFLYGFAKGADIDLSEASAQWAGYSVQLSDDKRRLIESQGEDSGFSEGQAFAKIYPTREALTLRVLVARNHLDPSTAQTNGWEEYAKDRTDTPVEELCTVRDGLNRATVYIEESGIVLANYASGSCLYENREAWLDAMPDLDRDAVLLEFPEVALGTCFEIESEEPSELLHDGVKISLERLENVDVNLAAPNQQKRGFILRPSR